MNPAVMTALGAPQKLAGVIEVTEADSTRNHTGESGVSVECDLGSRLNGAGSKANPVFKKTFVVNGHNYLFTSGCCMKCIEVKHKKMLRAYLQSHGVTGIKLWWKMLRA